MQYDVATRSLNCCNLLPKKDNFHYVVVGTGTGIDIWNTKIMRSQFFLNCKNLERKWNRFVRFVRYLYAPCCAKTILKTSRIPPATLPRATIFTRGGGGLASSLRNPGLRRYRHSFAEEKNCGIMLHGNKLGSMGEL